MHSNIYSRDEMLHHRSSFDLYATALKPCGSSAILAPRARDQVIKQLLVLQPQRAGLWLEALAVRDELYEPISERCGTVRPQCWPPCC